MNTPQFTLRFSLLFIGSVMTMMTTEAHHSVAALYDEQREMTLEVTVREFHFVNPHPYVLVAAVVKEAAQEWKLEMDNRFEMSAMGMTQDTLKPGDRLRIVGNPANQWPQTLYIRKLLRPADGYAYEQAGFSPRLLSPAR